MAKEVEVTAEAPVEKVVRENQNGVTRPKADSKTGQVWAISDSLSAKTKAPAKRAEVLAACEEAGINKSTATTQFGRWRTFNGVKPEVKAPKAPKEPKAPKAVKKTGKGSSKTDAQTKADNDAADEKFDAENA